MSRALLTIHSDADRRKAAGWCAKAPAGCRIEFKAPKRSLPQNDKLWAALTEVSEQATWAGKRRTPHQWKDLFTGALRAAEGHLEAVPGLEGGFMILGLSTSDMTAAEMTSLIDYIAAWGAQNGVTFRTDEQEAA